MQMYCEVYIQSGLVWDLLIYVLRIKSFTPNKYNISQNQKNIFAQQIN